ncbi:MAG: 6-hydroxymethylpterin diphosphokinase MptE-like protein [Desulfurococcaceae archaeon]
MNIIEWMKKYRWIASKLDIDIDKDQLSSRRLSIILGSEFVKQSELKNIIEDNIVIIIGFGVDLDTELDYLYRLKHLLDKSVIVVVDKAIGRVLDYGFKIDIFITDLDFDMYYLDRISSETIFIIHSHGDNVDRIELIVPYLLEKGFKIHGTTQVESLWNVFNYGGFTDGDRALYLVNYFKPRRVILVGMDFNKLLNKNVIDKYYGNGLKHLRKIVKLEIAEKLLEELICKTNTFIYSLSRNFLKCIVRISENDLISIIRD